MKIKNKNFAFIFFCLIINILSAKNQTLEQINLLLENKNIPADVRYFTADTLLQKSYELTPQERLDIVQTQFNTFINQNLSGDALRVCQAWNYHLLGILQPDNGYSEIKTAYLDTAISLAEHLPDSKYKARIYLHYANHQSLTGSSQTAHTYFYKTIHMSEALPQPDYACISQSYYQLAINFLNMKDSVGMMNILTKMENLCQKVHQAYARYDLYSVKSAYYSMLLDQNAETTALRDSMIQYGYLSIKEMENIKDPNQYQIFPTWNYYNMAVFYDLYFDEPVQDSIEWYLDKSEQATEQFVHDDLGRFEAYASIYDMRAWLYFYHKNYKKAEQTMNRVVLLLDTLDKMTPNTVVTERGEAYRFFIELYETIGQLQKALHYQKLLTENNQKRYNIEKNRALHEIQAQYEIEQKEQQIIRIQEQNDDIRKKNIFITVIAVVCFLLLVFLCIIIQLQRRNTNLRMYETALIADSAREELIDRQSALKQLEQQYAQLQNLAEKNQTNAKRYAEELAQLKKQLNNSSVQIIVDKLLKDLDLQPTNSLFYEDTIAKLNALNTEQANRIFSLANEPLSTMEKKYLLCFLSGIKTENIASLFHIEPASVYSVRYRIRKKYSKKEDLPF